MKRILIILILAITFITTCRLIHFFEDENGIVNTTTTTVVGTTTTRGNSPMILVIDPITNNIITNNSTKDLGLILLGIPSIEITLKIKNAGQKDLEIKSITTKDVSDCTVVIQQKPKNILKQQEESEGKLLVDLSTDNPFEFSFTIEINSNDPHIPLFKIYIKGKKVRALYVSEKTGNDASNDGTETRPYKTITKAISSAMSGTLICVAAGTYNETIDLTKDCSLYGGYYCEGGSVNWNDRNFLDREDIKYKTSINSIAISNASQIEIEGLFVTSNISMTNSNNIVIKNNTINTNNTTPSIGIFNNNSFSFITIRNNKIVNNTLSNVKGISIDSSAGNIEILENHILFGGNSMSNTWTYGIYGENLGGNNISGNNIRINNNRIDMPKLSVNSSTTSYGIYCISSNISNHEIRNNIITLKEATSAYGIYAKNVNIIENNIITTDNSNSYSSCYGIFSDNCQRIFRNSIVLHGNSTSYKGINTSPVSPPMTDNLIYNNIIHIINDNTGSEIDGINMENVNDKVKILNNTIFMNNKSNLVKGINIGNNSFPYIENNIFYLVNGNGPGGPNNSYAIYETDLSSDPMTILNNDVFRRDEINNIGFAYYYYDRDATTESLRKIKLIGEFNLSLRTNQRDSSVNANINLAPIFKDPADPINNGLELLLETPGQIKNGGKMQNLFFNDDKLGRSRTPPWSIGAYECDQ